MQRLLSKAFGKNFHGRDDIQLRLACVDGVHPHIKHQIEALAINDLDELISKAEIFHHKKSRPKEIQVCQVQEDSDLRIEGERQGQNNGENKVPPQTKRKKGECFNCGNARGVLV